MFAEDPVIPALVDLGKFKWAAFEPLAAPAVAAFKALRPERVNWRLWEDNEERSIALRNVPF